MSENKERGAGGVERGVIAGLLEALADKHSELNINLQKVTIRRQERRNDVHGLDIKRPLGLS
jgi:hypothetical protein